MAGLAVARKQGRVGGRPRKNYKHEKHAKRICQLREDGKSYQEIADESGRSKTNRQNVQCTWLCVGTSNPSHAGLIPLILTM